MLTGPALQFASWDSEITILFSQKTIRNEDHIHQSSIRQIDHIYEATYIDALLILDRLSNHFC